MRMQEELAKEIAELGDLSRDELVGRWIRVHGTPPPKGIKQGLLLRSAAWHLQKRRLGGLTAESSRVLKATMRRIEASHARQMEGSNVARDRVFHPVREYLDSVSWDDIDRIDDWLSVYLGANDTP